MSRDSDERRLSPAVARNRGPILGVLKRLLPPEGTVLEVASGGGEHAVYLAPHFPGLSWQPSDPDAGLRASIRAWIEDQPAANLRPPVALDARDRMWPVEALPPEPAIAAILCINMIHIAPWPACLGLLAGAGRILPAAGMLFLYGPFMREGHDTAPSNQAFDASLRAQNPDWGVRDLGRVAEAADGHGLELDEVIGMPANNLSVVFRRGRPSG